MAHTTKTLAQLVLEGKVLIDSADLANYIACAARVHSEGYITVRVHGVDHYLHRLIMQPGDLHVDHINGVQSDNQRSNLRIVTRGQNMANAVMKSTNRSGYKGVALHKGKYWAAGIMKDRKQLHIGYYPTAELAALAYNKKALELHGEHASLNIISQELLS